MSPHNRDVFIAFGLVAVIGVGAALAETDPDFCKDYVQRDGEECLYPTQPTEVGELVVCRCPRSRPCGGQP